MDETTAWLGAGTDWTAWHSLYDDPMSGISQRLRVVQQHVRAVLDARAGQATRIVSACAGEGRDVIPVLAGRADRDNVSTCLIEADTHIADVARDAASRAGLDSVNVVCADAGQSDTYADLVPADLLLLCGIFGNITDHDIRQTIEFAPRLLTPGGAVIWTRHRRPPDFTPAIRERLSEAGFSEVAFHPLSEFWGSVGVHQLTREPLPFESGARLFTFFPDPPDR